MPWNMRYSPSRGSTSRGKLVGRADDRLKRRANIAVAALLVACQCATIAAQERQMWGELLAERHSCAILPESRPTVASAALRWWSIV